MNREFDKLANFAQTCASLNNMRENMDMKNMAKEILLEENYLKYMKSYKFTFWAQLLGTLAGFVVPSAVLYLLFKDMAYCLFGVAIGVLWICVWLPLSLVMPQTRIYRKFAKWYRNKHATLDELDDIFYKIRPKKPTVSDRGMKGR